MRLSPSDLKSLAVFRSVVIHEGFVGAQIALGMSQSAVSQHIKSLEDRLGFRLCSRGRGGFRLTHRGELVFEHSQSLFQSVNQFEGDVAKLKNRIAGTLRLGLVDNILTDMNLCMPKIIRRFGLAAPEATLDIHISSPKDLLKGILQGMLDVCIMPQIQTTDPVNTSLIYHETHQLYCGTEHELFRIPEAELNLDKLAGYPFVVRPYANLVELMHIPKAKATATASNIEAQAMFILSGNYIGYLPDHFALQLVHEGRLKPLLSEQTAIQSPFTLMTHVDRKASAVIDVFVRELVYSLSQTRC